VKVTLVKVNFKNGFDLIEIVSDVANEIKRYAPDLGIIYVLFNRKENKIVREIRGRYSLHELETLL